jgi:FkbH-like protein
MDLRKQIDQRIANGDVGGARCGLIELWTAEPTPAAASFVVSRFEKLRGSASLVSCRVAILRSFTVEPIVPLLRAEAFTFGIDLNVHVGDFNAYAQEILDGDSAAHRFAPDLLILAVLARDIAPELVRDYADLAPDAIDAVVSRVAAQFQDWIRVFRSRSQAHVVVHSLERPTVPALGILDAQSDNGQSAAIDRINQQLRRVCREHHGVYLLDYDSLVARHGRLRWRDDRKWLVARLPVAAERLIDVAREWMRFVAPISGRLAKALVVDLDNTLWGGVIGEDGIGAIQIGAEYPGASYQALQRAMLDLSRKGILLAICSKNNAEDAMEVLDRHPGMLVRPAHFAAIRINWNEKVQSLREIAQELNIGVDALAFMDDNPVECDRIRASLPEVTVIHLSGDPLTHADTLRACPVFERLTLSTEDRERHGMYAAERERSNAKQRFGSKEDFYRFLAQTAEIAPARAATTARIAQLTQKTNQFNVTTRRYTEQQIADMAASADCHVLGIRVRDRYGDNGLVGVAITRDVGADCEIDTFLLSCRVIGRTVETALLSFLAESARSRNCSRLVGWFLPTRKNAPAKDFYRQHRFALIDQDGQGSRWALDLRSNAIACPDWITLRVENDSAIESVAAGSSHRR